MSDYEYKGLMAQAWDLLRGDTSGWVDRFFFLDLVRQSGTPVLDVGCGTGRLLLDFLAQGIDADGVDNSPEMLELCRQKAAPLGLKPALYLQEMQTLDLPRRYRTIMVPSSSLQLVIDPLHAASAMQRMTAHLLPGGSLGAPFMTLWAPGEPLESTWEKTAQRPEDGATIRRVARSWFDPESECESTEDLYQVIVGGKVTAEEIHQRSPATRSYAQAQARALFEAAGLVNIRAYHEFTFEPVRPEDSTFCLVGERPA